MFACSLILLSGCSTLSSQDTPLSPPAESNAVGPPTPQPPSDQNTLQDIDVSKVNTQIPLVSGSINKMMETEDKVKLSRALDKAPGKITVWTNQRSGFSYSVTPVRKIVIDNNPFCREYEIIATKANNEQKAQGTACIGSDGDWHTI